MGDLVNYLLITADQSGALGVRQRRCTYLLSQLINLDAGCRARAVPEEKTRGAGLKDRSVGTGVVSDGISNSGDDKDGERQGEEMHCGDEWRR